MRHSLTTEFQRQVGERVVGVNEPVPAAPKDEKPRKFVTERARAA
jgi:hypothetical protein